MDANSKVVTYNAFSRVIRMDEMSSEIIQQMEDAMERGCREHKLVCMSSNNKKVEFGKVFSDTNHVWLMSADPSHRVCVNVYDRNDTKTLLCEVWMDSNDLFEYLTIKAQSILGCEYKELETFLSLRDDAKELSKEARASLENILLSRLRSLRLEFDVNASAIVPFWRKNARDLKERLDTAWAEAESFTSDPITRAIHCFFHTHKKVNGLYTPMSTLLKHFRCHMKL